MTKENPYEPPRSGKITENAPSKTEDAREWVADLIVINIVGVIAAVMIAAVSAVLSSGWLGN